MAIILTDLSELPSSTVVRPNPLTPEIKGIVDNELAVLAAARDTELGLFKGTSSYIAGHNVNNNLLFNRLMAQLTAPFQHEEKATSLPFVDNKAVQRNSGVRSV